VTCCCWFRSQVGGSEEYKIVEAIESKRITKPVVAWCIGTCAKMFTSEVCGNVLWRIFLANSIVRISLD